jgi:hypothetical protein
MTIGVSTVPGCTEFARIRRAALTSVSPGTLLAIDEGSMMTGPDMADLISLAETRGGKLIVAGDTSQLQAVQNGGGMALLADRLGYARLLEPVRFSAPPRYWAATAGNCQHPRPGCRPWLMPTTWPSCTPSEARKPPRPGTSGTRACLWPPCRRSTGKNQATRRNGCGGRSVPRNWPA